MRYSIYLIQNMVDGKSYIGITQRCVRLRWRLHIADSKRFDYPISRAIREFGQDQFHVSILCDADVTREELKNRERAYIALFGTMNPEFGYNVSSGGSGCEGFKMPREIADRLAKQQRGHVVSAETRLKLRNAHLGKKRSIESIEKTAAQRRGMKFPPAWRAKMSIAQRRIGRGINRLANGKWQARITTDGGRLFLGSFDTEMQAIAKVAFARETQNASISK